MRWLACVLLFICAICDANDDLGAYTACRYSYDSTGNRTEKDCDGPKTTYRWDSRGNLLETSTSAQTIRYEWSSDNRQNGGAWQETRYTHTPDGVGQLISEQRQGKMLHVYEDVPRQREADIYDLKGWQHTTWHPKESAIPEKFRLSRMELNWLVMRRISFCVNAKWRAC